MPHEDGTLASRESRHHPELVQATLAAEAAAHHARQVPHNIPHEQNTPRAKPKRASAAPVVPAPHHQPGMTCVVADNCRYTTRERTRDKRPVTTNYIITLNFSLKNSTTNGATLALGACRQPASALLPTTATGNTASDLLSPCPAHAASRQPVALEAHWHAAPSHGCPRHGS